MADSKISALSAATSVGATDQMVVAAGGATKKVSGQVLGVCSGTAMPTGATNDRVFRTDLGLMFYYDGTRWLSVNMFKQTVAQSLTGISATSGTQGYLATSTIGSGLDMWLVSMEATFQVATTNTGSAFWTVEFEKVVAAGTATSLGTIVTSADSPDTWVSRSTSIGAALGGVSTYKLIRAKATKTSTPGNLFYALALNYRLIGT